MVDLLQVIALLQAAQLVVLAALGMIVLLRLVLETKARREMDQVLPHLRQRLDLEPVTGGTEQRVRPPAPWLRVVPPPEPPAA